MTHTSESIMEAEVAVHRKISSATWILISLLSLSISPTPAKLNSPPSEKSAPAQKESGATSWDSFKDLRYVPDTTDKAHLLDLYVPHAVKKQNWPLIVFIHGGGWVSGDKSDCPRLAPDRGYAMASINYRLSDQATFPAQIFDCKAAIRYLRSIGQQYGLNTKKIGVWGASAGGHLVALLGTTNGEPQMEGTEGDRHKSSDVQAVCDWFGPTNLLAIASEAGPDNDLSLSKPNSIVTKFLGGEAKDKVDLAKAADPCTHVKKNAPPFLILHGDKDTLVPYAQSQELYKALQDAGVDSQMITMKGAGHGFSSPEAFSATMDFFDRVIQGKKSK